MLRCQERLSPQSVLPGHLIRQSRTHSRNGDGRGRGERSQSIRTLSPSSISQLLCGNSQGAERERLTQPKAARDRQITERGERGGRDAAFILYFVCGIGMGQGRQRAANAAPPRDRSLGITDEECSERTYIIGHIHADRVRTVVLACLRDGARIVCAAARILNQSK